MIVSRRFAYHGVNAYGTSLGGIAANREGFGTLVEDVLVVADDDPAELAAALDELGPRAAAFIGEPVIGAGGVIPPPDGYWPEVERILRERDVLFVADEVICGFGRVGEWFGVRALRRHARHDHLRQGHHVRLHPARRGDRVGQGARAVLGRRARRRSGTATRTRATPRRARSRSRTSTSSSARA